MATKLRFSTNFGLDGDSEGTLIVDDINNRIGIKNYDPAYTLDVDGDLNITTGSVFRINGNEVLSSTLLSSTISVNSSSLTGTISGDRGVISGSASSSFVKYNGTTSSSGAFYGGTTAPSGNTRLNYAGDFYATNINGNLSITASTSISDVLSYSSNTISGVDAASDKLIFWDDSESKITYLTLGSGLSITGTTITATGGGGGGSSISLGNTSITISDTGTDGTITFITEGTTAMTLSNSQGLGIGTASPQFKGDINGDFRIQSANKLRFGGTTTTTNFYVQYNSTTNSLDFIAG